MVKNQGLEGKRGTGSGGAPNQKEGEYHRGLPSRERTTVGKESKLWTLLLMGGGEVRRFEPLQSETVWSKKKFLWYYMLLCYLTIQIFTFQIIEL